MTSISLFSCCSIFQHHEHFTLPNPRAKRALEKIENGELAPLKASLKPTLEAYLDFQLIELPFEIQRALEYFSRYDYAKSSNLDATKYVSQLQLWRESKDRLSLQQAYCEAIGCHKPVIELSRDIFNQWIENNLAKIQTVTALDLKNRRISKLPREIGFFTALQTLNVANNNIETLPDEMRLCSKLTQLNLSNNRFSALPQVVVDLPNLVSLEICNNKLVGLTEEISKLSALQCLNISSNQITNLPATITALRSLRILDVTANPLSGLLPSLPTRCTVEQTAPGLAEMFSQLLRLS